jgi:hypothetical protein
MADIVTELSNHERALKLELEKKKFDLKFGSKSCSFYGGDMILYPSEPLFVVPLFEAKGKQIKNKFFLMDQPWDYGGLDRRKEGVMFLGNATRAQMENDASNEEIAALHASLDKFQEVLSFWKGRCNEPFEPRIRGRSLKKVMCKACDCVATEFPPDGYEDLKGLDDAVAEAHQEKIETQLDHLLNNYPYSLFKVEVESHPPIKNKEKNWIENNIIKINMTEPRLTALYELCQKSLPSEKIQKTEFTSKLTSVLRGAYEEVEKSKEDTRKAILEILKRKPEPLSP